MISSLFADFRFFAADAIFAAPPNSRRHML